MEMSPENTGILTHSVIPRILAMHEDASTRNRLELCLGALGFDVSTVSDPRALASLVAVWLPEAVLVGLDASHPHRYSVIAAMRRVTDVPLLMVNADAAAPYDWHNLAAHIRARLSRASRAADAAALALSSDA
jgi:PleD family two-component response regulator